MDYSSLDKNSSEQLFLQIRRIVLTAIREQGLLAGQRLPSVNELSEQLDVSRMTVRQALQTLIEEGWLYTVPGKGTFVAQRPHIEQNLQHLQGWNEEIRIQGMRPTTRLISVDVVPADRNIARHLDISAGEAVFRIVRVRYAEDFPLAVEKAHLVAQRFPNLDQFIRQPQASLYHILRQNYGQDPTRAVQFLEAGQVDQATAELLEVPPGSPALISERITYTAGDHPLEYVTGVTRPGFVRYKTELNANSTTFREFNVPMDK